jgi:hypothetical protein
VSNNGKLGAPSPRNLFEVSRESDVADNCSKNLRNAGQARCFINGLGGIVNPGFGKPKGFMPEVQTFNLTAVGAKAKPTDHRLSLFVNLTPSTWDGAIDQALPGSAKDPSEVPLGKSPRTTTANVPTIPTEKGDQGSAPDKDEEGVPGSKTTYRNSGSQASGCNVSGGLLRPHAVGEFTWLRPATVWVPVAGFVVAIASAFGRRRQRR